jgi:hypothetical protein
LPGSTNFVQRYLVSKTKLFTFCTSVINGLRNTRNRFFVIF